MKRQFENIEITEYLFHEVEYFVIIKKSGLVYSYIHYVAGNEVKTKISERRNNLATFSPAEVD